jgi:hypothetical protein
MPKRGDALALLAGAVSAAGAVATIDRATPGQRRPLLAGGLLTAAAIYPLARRSRALGPALTRELTAMVAFGAVALVGLRQAGPTGTRILAAGWAAHAVFDAAHDCGEDSLIPSWYPALCAGYDLVIAASLVKRV